MKHIQTFENFSKKYGEKMSQEDFYKIVAGTEIMYAGGKYTVTDHNGATIVLTPVKGGSPTMINLSQFNQNAAIV